MILAPIMLDYDEIKDKENDDLLFQEEGFSVFKNKELSFKGLPVDSGD